MRIFLAVSTLLLVASLTTPAAAQDTEQPKNPPPQHLVDITSSELKETPAGWTFTVKGTSMFPDDTEASLTIRFFEEWLAGMPVVIRNGRFEASFEGNEYWPGKKFFPGNYELEVEIRYKRQSRGQRKLIVDKLGEQGKTRAYRNKYITLGDKETRKREEDRIKDHYVKAIKEANKLSNEMDGKARAASEKFLRRFAIRDEDGKPIPDPNNKYAYLVDEDKWLAHLRDNPNELYDKDGKFKEDAWCKWLDDNWRPRWKNLYLEHKDMLGDYVALPWPREYNDMRYLLKFIMARSAGNSINIYRWNGLPPHKEDTCFRPPLLPPSRRSIVILLERIKQKLKLAKYIREKKRAAEERERERKKKKERKGAQQQEKEGWGLARTDWTHNKRYFREWREDARQIHEDFDEIMFELKEHANEEKIEETDKSDLPEEQVKEADERAGYLVYVIIAIVAAASLAAVALTLFRRRRLK